MRIATWHADYSRKGPGLFLKEVIAAEVDLGPILAARPDVLLLTDVDYDAGHAALAALAERLAEGGLVLEHRFATRPNTGMPTGLDLDGDGYRGGPRDAQGYGWFAGQGGMAVLSRFPVAGIADHSGLLWRDVPGSAVLPEDRGVELQRLSSSAHWAVSVEAPGGPLTLLTLAATPPVFDGPEDRNGRRNRDEVLLWLHVLEGKLGDVPEAPLVLMGNFNLDPERGDGLREAARKALAHPRLQDPLPGRATVTWDKTGPMRVSYVLPDAGLKVLDAGVTDPAQDAGPHGLVWVDVAPP